MRLIDAKAALRAIYDLYAQPRIELWQVVSAIEHTPTVDAAEVVHGKWTERPVNVNTPTTDLFCSVCDFPAWRCRYIFCPNCGAKMDGGAKDENT